jgi:hypothetical protein
MGRAPLTGTKARAKRRTYVLATVAAMAIFLPFQHQVGALYAAACVGYTILVFGLRRSQFKTPPPVISLPPTGALLTHATYLVIVAAWVWLLIVLSPHAPYFLRAEDSGRPYFGMAFIGVFGLMLLEAAEQRSLHKRIESDASDSSTL